MNLIRKLSKVLLPLLALGIGVGTFVLLVTTRPEAERAEREKPGVLVEVEQARAGNHEVHVRAQGTVIPARRVVVQPEISGRVIWRNDELVPGGRLKKGARIARIDSREYRLALEARRAEISRARTELRLERSRQDIAAREWQLFGEPDAGTEDGGALALREPQVETAQIAVQAAKSALEQAELNLARTQLTAPFNALVIQESVEVGQIVTPQTQLATLVGTDRFRVQVSIPVEALASIDVPGMGRASQGSSARVIQTVGGERIEREGRIVQLLADLDPSGAMARILIEVEDPLGLERPDGSLPMLLNSYVQVEIDARPLEGAIEIPRAALREGSKVFVMTESGRLSIRPVQIVWRREDSVLVREGLEDGDRVVVSRVPTPVEGMRLRLSSENKGAGEGRVAERGSEEQP